jgi:glycosyltransferase involved in cell wall biosynthesis
MRAKLEERIAAAGLGDVVFLTGARNDIAHLMQTFSVFALSSIAEGTPVTLLEAMATGLPVVSTAVGGIPALVADGATGMLAPAGDAKALARALAAYVENDTLAAGHGAAGRSRIESEYSIATMLSAYMALYDTLCKNKINLKEVIKPCAE